MRRVLSLLAALLLAPVAARAQVPEVRFAQQFSMAYLQFNVMKHRGLIEKHAKAAGIPEVKVSWVTFNGPDAMNDALLSGAIDIASGGVPGLITIWAKTWKTPQEVRGVSGLSQQPVYLTSRDPSIRSIRDFKPTDRIALPAVKVSAQAVWLQMAAAKEWGDEHFDRLDALTFSMSPPDATNGMLAGNKEFTSSFTVPPFQNMQLKDKSIHIVMDSHDLVGPSTGGTAWTTKRFHDGNPALYKAVVAALAEASDFVAANLEQTADYYIADTRMKVDRDLMLEIMRDPRNRYVMLPQNTTKYAEFMFKRGRIKVAPASWKDMFWPEIHHMDGS
jgi:NitT/TauT family transport system substrate-binding protein